MSVLAETPVVPRGYEDVRVHGFDPERAERSIAGIGHTLRQIYARAAAGKNTLLAAKELAAERSGIELGGI
jgi:hypothetical protein